MAEHRLISVDPVADHRRFDIGQKCKRGFSLAESDQAPVQMGKRIRQGGLPDAVEDANDQVIRLVLVGQAMSTTAA